MEEEDDELTSGPQLNLFCFQISGDRDGGAAGGGVVSSRARGGGSALCPQRARRRGRRALRPRLLRAAHRLRANRRLLHRILPRRRLEGSSYTLTHLSIKRAWI